MDFVEIIGLAASLIVAVSLMMSSVVKLRWYNLFGSVIFSVYGVIIESVPVAFVNVFIVFINVWYLRKIYSEKEQFKLFSVSNENEYLFDFLNFHIKELSVLFPDFNENMGKESLNFFIHRNLSVAGLLCGRLEKGSFYITIDFVIPQYRDLKVGKFVFMDAKPYFEKFGIERFIAKGRTKMHIDYLKKIGFEQLDNSSDFELKLN